MANDHLSRTLLVFQDLVERLRIDTRADRTTIRADCHELGLALETVAAESLAEGVNPLKSQTTPGFETAPLLAGLPLIDAPS